MGEVSIRDLQAGFLPASAMPQACLPFSAKRATTKSARVAPVTDHIGLQRDCLRHRPVASIAIDLPAPVSLSNDGHSAWKNRDPLTNDSVRKIAGMVRLVPIYCFPV